MGNDLFDGVDDVGGEDEVVPGGFRINALGKAFQLATGLVPAVDPEVGGKVGRVLGLVEGGAGDRFNIMGSEVEGAGDLVEVAVEGSEVVAEVV